MGEKLTTKGKHMPVFNRKNRDEVKEMLIRHSDLTDAIENVRKKHFSCGINMSNKNDDSYFLDVSINNDTARKVFQEQKSEVEAKLKKLGVVVG